jgi:hypothetical protein
METDTGKPALRNNPFFVISIALVVALLMSAASLVSYYRSDTRETVEQIQLNNINGAALVEKAIPEELSPEYIDDVEKSIEASVSSMSAEVDYNADELTDSALGL